MNDTMSATETAMTKTCMISSYAGLL